MLNRIAVSGRYDAAKQRFTVDAGRSRQYGRRHRHVRQCLDYAGGDPRLAAGLAATRMPSDTMKRLWPAFVAPKVRDWFNEHLMAGNVERLTIAVNAPYETLKDSGPPLPDDGLTIDALATDCVLRPVDGLPALHDADLTVHIVGPRCADRRRQSRADMPSGRKLALSSGVFEVPDTAPRHRRRACISNSTARYRPPPNW